MMYDKNHDEVQKPQTISHRINSEPQLNPDELRKEILHGRAVSSLTIAEQAALEIDPYVDMGGAINELLDSLAENHPAEGREQALNQMKKIAAEVYSDEAYKQLEIYAKVRAELHEFMHKIIVDQNPLAIQMATMKPLIIKDVGWVMANNAMITHLQTKVENVEAALKIVSRETGLFDTTYDAMVKLIQMCRNGKKNQTHVYTIVSQYMNKSQKT